MKPRFSIASDYATVHSENFNAYYGYERTDEEGRWCFVAEFGDTKITIPSHRLKVKDQYEVVDCLLKGIAWLFMAFEINPERTDL